MKSRPVTIPPFSVQISRATYCTLETAPAPGTRLRVVCAGREECLPVYEIKRPGYVCLVLEYVAQGQGRLVLAGKSYNLLPGHIFVYGPGVAHHITSSHKTPLVKYFVDYFGPEASDEDTLGPGEIRRVVELEPFTRLFDEMIREGNKPAPHRGDICAQYLRLLLLKSREAIPYLAGTPEQSFENLSRCRDYIDAHYAELTGLHDLAAAIHLDKSYVCRLFARFRLPSPHSYLTDRKLMRAAELLLSTSHPVKTVANEVGYADALHFSRLFRRRHGVSPDHFRKTHSRSIHPRPPQPRPAAGFPPK